uniref:Uncharacterized protein n=1 Tax=Takifugu rubripes TaxID=31033 RepID=A0A3B5KEX9_TAKRU
AGMLPSFHSFILSFTLKIIFESKNTVCVSVCSSPKTGATFLPKVLVHHCSQFMTLAWKRGPPRQLSVYV